LIALGLAACTGSTASPITPREQPPSPAGIDRAVFERELDVTIDLADRTCACTDTACFEQVDTDLAAYLRVATVNDPLTARETWPGDLAALGKAEFRRMYGCMRDHGYRARATGVVVLRKVDALREAACACSDAGCARRVSRVSARFATRLLDHVPRASPEVADAIVTSEHALIACLAAPIREQEMLDLRAIRTDACACEDAACADEEAVALATVLRAGIPLDIPNEEIDEIVTDVGACLGKLRPP
jgi:hypothetical protein